MAKMLKEIKNSLNEKEVKVISFLLERLLQKKDIVGVRELHNYFGGKLNIRPEIEKMGGTIIREVSEHREDYYKLTILGILLSNDGEEYFKLLVDYLNFSIELSTKEFSRTHITSLEATKALNLSEVQVYILGYMLRNSKLGVDGSYSTTEWNLRLPRNIEDLAIGNINDYLDMDFSSEYDRNMPLDDNQRVVYLNSKDTRNSTSEFSFISSNAIKTIIETDWREANIAFENKVWKGCVVLCGSVLEGLLLDVLTQNRESVLNSSKASKLKELNRARLIDLIDLAEELKILSNSSSYLGHALREYRNLVHPGRQLSEILITNEEEASIAINAVKRYIREIRSIRETGL